MQIYISVEFTKLPSLGKAKQRNKQKTVSGLFPNSTNEMIMQILYLHWAGSFLTFTWIISGNLFLPKVTRNETSSSTSFCETLGRSYFTTLRLLCLYLIESEMVLRKVFFKRGLVESIIITLSRYRKSFGTFHVFHM